MAKQKKIISLRELDERKLQILSPDADGWDNLVAGAFDYLNLENSVYGVLLYPKVGVSKGRLDTLAIDWIGSKYTFAEGGLDTKICSRGDNWAICYHITSWYKHFDLPENFD